MGKEIAKTSLMLTLGCLLAAGCGAPDSTGEENYQGKAENLSDPENRLENNHLGYALTLGQEDSFETAQEEIQVFSLKLLEGSHGYALSISQDEIVLMQHIVQTRWRFVTPDEDFDTAVESLKESLGDCDPNDLDCANNSAKLTSRNLGIFEGPGRLALAVRLTNRPSYQYAIKIDEIPPIKSERIGLLVVGWNDSYDRSDQGDRLDQEAVALPQPAQIPEKGEVITLKEDVVIFRDKFLKVAPWQSALYLAPRGTRLRFIKDHCETMDIQAELMLIACKVRAELE